MRKAPKPYILKGPYLNSKGKCSGTISSLFFMRKAPKPYVLKGPCVIQKENVPEPFPYCFS
jgi:hypothetical protein